MLGSLSLSLSLVPISCCHHYPYRRNTVTYNQYLLHYQTHTVLEVKRTQIQSPTAHPQRQSIDCAVIQTHITANQHPSIPPFQPQQCASSPPPAKTAMSCAAKTDTTLPVQSQTSTAAPTTNTTTRVPRGLTRARRQISGAACRGAVACMILSLGAVGGKSITCGPVALMCGSAGCDGVVGYCIGLGVGNGVILRM